MRRIRYPAIKPRWRPFLSYAQSALTRLRLRGVLVRAYVCPSIHSSCPAMVSPAMVSSFRPCLAALMIHSPMKGGRTQ